MATQAQIDANRRNSLKSTGPRTDAGRAAAGRNAVRHGLWAGEAVIAGEDPAEFAAFRERMWRALRPRGVLQACVVERLANLHWKLRRIPGLEAATVRELLAQHGDPQPADGFTREQVMAVMAKDVAGRSSVLHRLQMHEMRLEHAIRANLKELKRLQEEEEPESEELDDEDAADAPADPGVAVVAEAPPARNEAKSALTPQPPGSCAPARPAHAALVRAVNAVTVAGATG